MSNPYRENTRNCEVGLAFIQMLCDKIYIANDLHSTIIKTSNKWYVN